MNDSGPVGIEALARTLWLCGVGAETRYGLVLRDSRVLCALPGERETARRTLSLYQPQRWRAKVLAAGFRLTAELGLHRWVLRRWRMPGPVSGAGNSRPVGVLVGSGGHLCERAVTVSREAGGWEVVKYAFGRNCGAILGGEAEMLRGLAEDARVPDLLDYDVDVSKGVARLRMAWQDGRPWRSEDLGPLLKLLDDWGGRGEARVLRDFPEWKWIGPVLGPLWQGGARFENLSRQVVLPSVRHGDLTRPNLREGKDGGLRVHDWERGAMEGIPGVDLVHYLVQDEFFRRRPQPPEVVRRVRERLTGPAVSGWLAKSGWRGRVNELMAVNFALNTGAGYLDQMALLSAVVEMEGSHGVGDRDE